MDFKLGALIGVIFNFIVSYSIMENKVLSFLGPFSGKGALGATIADFFSSFFVGHLFDIRQKRTDSGLKFFSAAVGVP